MTVIYYFLLIGQFAGFCHWAKKRYVDNTNRQCFICYMSNNKKATINYIIAMTVAEFSLAAVHTGDIFTLADFVAAFGAGYVSDSALNSGEQK